MTTITHYELRTKRGARVYAFDSLTRAEQEREKSQQRIGVKLSIFKVTHQEQELA